LKEKAYPLTALTLAPHLLLLFETIHYFGNSRSQTSIENIALPTHIIAVSKMEEKTSSKKISSLEDDWEEIETDAQIKKKEEESIRLEQVIGNTVQNPQIEVPEHQNEEMIEEYKEENQEHPQDIMEVEKVEQPDLANEHVDETFIVQDDEISEEKQENDEQDHLIQQEKIEYQQTPAVETLPESFLESSWMNDIRRDEVA